MPHYRRSLITQYTQIQMTKLIKISFEIARYVKRTADREMDSLVVQPRRGKRVVPAKV